MNFSRQEKMVLLFLGGVFAIALFVLYQRTAVTQFVPSVDQKPPGELVVQIQGAVHSPGVYRVPEGIRLYELVELAGGSTSEAALFELNLAAPLFDGQRVVVPATQSSPATSFSNLDHLVSEMDSGHHGSPLNQPLINVNSAFAGELQSLPGIGEVIAARIITHRQERGPFRQPEDLLAVPGIGEKKLEDIRHRITF